MLFYLDFTCYVLYQVCPIYSLTLLLNNQAVSMSIADDMYKKKKNKKSENFTASMTYCLHATHSNW